MSGDGAGGGHRPPQPPRYPFDAGAALETAIARGMRVRFKPGAQGYGWVYCPTCGYGYGETEAERAAWLLDLSYYARFPWACGACEPATAGQ